MLDNWLHSSVMYIHYSHIAQPPLEGSGGSWRLEARRSALCQLGLGGARRRQSSALVKIVVAAARVRVVIVAGGRGRDRGAEAF